MITPAFALTATERVLPRLALDFTTGSLDSRVTFTRAANTATRVNSSGLIELVNADVPRFDYNPVTLVCRGLLIEEARKNLLTYSEQFNNAAWTTLRATLSTNATTAPDGALSAELYTENTSAGAVTRGTQSASLTIVSGASYTLSCYLKNNGRRYVSLVVSNFATGLNSFVATFDLVNVSSTTQIQGTGTVSGSSIVDAGNGWYRCSVTGTVPTTAGIVVFTSATNATPTLSTYGRESYAVTSATGFYFWGAQLEAGGYPTSYIPTTNAAVDRNADIATMTGTNFSSWWTATTGGAAVKVLPSVASGTRPVVQLDNSTADNIISFRGNVADPELYIKATTDQVQIDAGTITANTAYNLAGAWNTDDCGAAVNGGTTGTDTSATIPTVTQARLGSDGTDYLNGHLQKFMYWPQRITNAEVQAFSK